MILGLDWWNTVSARPQEFGQLAVAVLGRGGQVHIVSAVGPKRAHSTRAEIQAAGVPHTAIHVVVFERPHHAPQRKLELCQRLGIEVFIDDRADTCALLAANGVLALQMTKPLDPDKADQPD